MSVPISKQSAALTDAGPSEEFLEPITTSSESTSEALATVIPSDVPEMAAQNSESLQEPQEHQEPFELMKLPIEIRRMIFKEFLVMGGSIMFIRHLFLKRKDSADKTDWRLKPPPFVVTGETDSRAVSVVGEEEMIEQRGYLKIFRVSKALYRETVPIYFGLNTFCFETLNLFERFVGKLRPDSRWQLARVRIYYYGIAPARAIKPIASCVGLRELTLEIMGSSIVPTRNNGSDGVQIQLFGMKDLLKVRGLTKLELIGPDYVYIGTDAIQGTACQEYADAMEARLQVLKQPIDPKTLKRLEKEDFPVKKMRTRFGVANVVTRDESKALAAQKKAATT